MSALLLLLGEFDHRLLNAVVARRRRRLDRLMRRITHLGDPGPTIAICLGLSLGWVPRLEGVGELALFALVASHLFVQLLKRTVTRPRPCLPPGHEFLVQLPKCFSFPSGHAAAGLSVALPLALAAPAAVGAPLLLLGLAVGASRCYLGVHYPGDVLVGWALAVLGVMLGAYAGVPILPQ
jgi:undecaprenyl-diphosphatase